MGMGVLMRREEQRPGNGKGAKRLMVENRILRAEKDIVRVQNPGKKGKREQK
jgi:hypothetical protein